MGQSTSTAGDRDTSVAWALALAAAAGAERAARCNAPSRFALSPDGLLHPLANEHTNALLAWIPGHGWESRLSPADPAGALLDLYLPVCSATTAHPITVGHLGQSLDGFIATHTGDSQFVTGPENIVHLHRMRALSDAVVVGAGTVAADDPLLTTRHVAGPTPIRVVFDPTRRLTGDYRLFCDPSAPTFYVCARSLVRPDETRLGLATVIGVNDDSPVTDVLQLLRSRGCNRIFVEGGGVTVSAFLEANLLDRLHMAIAPIIIGNGRPAIRLPARATLRECQRPRYRVFRMGGDVLFDCELASAPDDEQSATEFPPLTRVI